MQVERWRQVEEIFHAVVDLDMGARDAQLATLCGGDDRLLQDVRELLAADDRTGIDERVSDPHVGLRLGNYEIDDLIARGGMAAVYRAHRADDQFRQRVAIKIMDVRLSDRALVERFKAERQILAALEHPALTRLLDGGVTPLGAPYLVMEYVEGQPIDRYCDERRLDLADRVRLFIRVCAGVAFAHRNLVLHRDLKPSNILIAADGQPKVVDFGTAALLQPDRLATISRAPLTPAYASPEQLIEGAVGTASDQYSLGLVLYELLCGTVAFGTRTSLMGAVERALAGELPPALQDAVAENAAVRRRASPPRLRRQLSGDLGTIVGKTLAIDTASRYASVPHLAEDLERWLGGEPILGRPPSVVYRASRFVRRHWVAVSIAATLLVSLAAATAMSLRQAAIARTESEKARQLNRFLTQMLSSANPTWRNANAATAASITVREVLDGASELIGAELGSNPGVEAEMRRTLGQTYNGLGAAAQALPQLDRALELYRQQGDSLGVAISQAQRGLSHMHQGEFREAEQLLREARDVLRAQTAAVDPDLEAGVASDLAATIAYQHPGHPEAVALMREAIAIANRHGLNQLAAQASQNLSIALIRLGQLQEGESLLRDALRRWEGATSPPPERNTALRTLAVLLFYRGNYAEAEPVAARAVDGYRKQMAADHPLQANVAIWWGRILLAKGDLERGRVVVRDAVAAYRRQRPPGHLELALPLITLGVLHRLDGELIDSERLIREARAILAANPSSRDRMADAAGELGLTLRAMGRDADAQAMLSESHATLQALYGEAHPLTRQARARLRRAE